MELRESHILMTFITYVNASGWTKQERITKAIVDPDFSYLRMPHFYNHERWLFELLKVDI